MTRHRVLAFARYAEMLGSAEVAIDLAPGATVNALVHALRQLPGGALLPESVMVAVNRRQVDGDHPVAAGDELAILPPLAGG